MGSYLKINPIRLGKFNNAEYTNFMNRTLNQAVAVGIEKIGASEALIDNITANVNKMTEIVAQSRASVETAQIAETDKKADELIVYLMATFRTNLTSPIQAMRNAAETLYLKNQTLCRLPDASARSADSEDAWFVIGSFNRRYVCSYHNSWSDCCSGRTEYHYGSVFCPYRATNRFTTCQ